MNTCFKCGAEGTVRIQIARRGNRNAYLCETCATEKRSYYYESTEIRGKEKVCKDTFGVELETSFSSDRARAEIVMNDYVPTHDCTVDTEYKSPIMIGLNQFSKHCATFERLMAEGELGIDNTCGTHFHYGNPSLNIDYVRRFYHSLFLPLCEEMKLNSEGNVALWGRDFGTWARPITDGTYPEEHTNFVNVQHTHTIEFRICKFRNAKQMMAAARLCKKIGNIVIGFCDSFNDAPKDATRYRSITEYRKHKASVAGNKIRKAYIKALEEI